MFPRGLNDSVERTVVEEDHTQYYSNTVQSDAAPQALKHRMDM